jgi:hypothetical protein
MTTDTWHAPDDLLVRFATRPEAIEPVTAASIEQHLMVCPSCRAVTAHACEDLDDVWAEIADRVDRHATSKVGRVLRSFHLEHDAVRLVAATTLLRLQALGAILTLAAGAFFIAGEVETSVPFVAVAPLVVLGIVALAFTPGAEPAGEVSPSTPLFGFRLFVRRAVVVLLATLAPLTAASTVLPGAGLEPFAWLLPALALALGALALGTRYGPTSASIAVASGWVLALSVTASMQWHISAPDQLFATPGAQGVAALVALGSLLVLFHRRDAFDRMIVPTGGLL